MSKIAFCFLTYGDIHQGEIWKSFFSGHEDLYNIYVHNKTPQNDRFFSERIISNVIETRYGTITQLKASINLFNAAWDCQDNDYFVLVSGSCLPLHTFPRIYQTIHEQGHSLFKILAPQLGRLKFMKDQSVFNRSNFKTQATWMVMRRDDYPVIAENDMTDSVFGGRVFGVDHHYFINLFDRFNVPYKEFPVTWDNWAEPDVRKNPYHYGPKTYEELDNKTILNAKDEGSLFIRKVSPGCIIGSEITSLFPQ